MEKIEHILKNKWVLYTGAAILATAGGMWLYNALGNNSAPAPTTSNVGAGYTPAVYSSGYTDGGGYGSAVDYGGSGSTGQSSMDALNALMQFQAQQSGQSNDLATAQMNLNQQLGLASINSAQQIALANVQSNTTADLASLASTVSQSLVNKGGAAISGLVSGGGQNLNFSVENITGNWHQDKTLLAGNGITLLGGGTTNPKAA